MRERVGRREREYFIHRQEILQAAEKVFAVKGFFQTTMNEIAQAAEFGTGTLYKFFRSKEDLYFTLIDEKVEGINQLVDAELSKKRPALERIREAVKLQLEFIEGNRDFFRIYTSERGRFEWTLKDEVGKGIHDKMVTYIRLLARVMKQGVKEGMFKPLDPFDLAHALVGIVNSFVFEWLISRQTYSLISKGETIMEIFLRGAEKT